MQEKQWAEAVAEKIKEKELKTAQRNVHKVPYCAFDGVYEDLSGERIGWWTNGFWGGIMWQLDQATGEQVFRDNAEELEVKLDAALMNSRCMDHDSGFRWLPTAVANYKISGSKESFNRGRVAADNLAGRFNIVGRFIRAWNEDAHQTRAGWAIIDCMMNLPLLYWAGDETQDPRYYHIAKAHADTAIKAFIREDGSSNHIVCFDPENGEILESLGGQGSHVGSSWTRGQSWALYGFTLSYMHTKEQRYLDTAKKVADYWVSCIPESGLIPVDFRQPEGCDFEDSTAAAIAACGLLELEKFVEGAEKEKYHNAAITMLKAMDEKRADWDCERDGILSHCSAAFHEKDHNLYMMYADYYFIEAIWKLTGQELFIW